MKLFKTTNRLTAFLVFNTIALGLVLPMPSAAAPFTTLDIPISLTDVVSHSYDSVYEDLGDTIGMRAARFTTDLGTLTGMTSRFEAPSGQSYFVNPPASVSPVLRLNVDYSGSGSSSTTEQWTHTITLLGVQGTAPTEVSTRASGRVEGNEVDLVAIYQVNGPFSFTGFDVSIDGPFSSAGVQTYTASSLLSAWFMSPTDTGPFVTLVPEPATLSLLTLGGLALLRRRRVG